MTLVGVVMGAAHDPRWKLVDDEVVARLRGIAFDDDLGLGP